MFVDEAVITVRGGRGGSGSGSFRSAPFEPNGGPDGGDGGRGGNVILVADPETTDLARVSRRRAWPAEDGIKGAGGRKGGRRGEDLTIQVPVGTVAFDVDSGDVLADLSLPGQTVVAAEGGRGGGGNVKRVSSINRAPQSAGPGIPGETRELRLELRLPVDVALVGPANSGKSTLLAALTGATPEIADYPFTTREPYLGVLFREPDAPLTLVEIPAGQRWLRHALRARLLVVCVESRTELKALERSLREADPRLADRPRVVVVRGAAGPGAIKNRIINAHAAAPEIVPEAAVRRHALERGLDLPLSVMREAWGFQIRGSAVERVIERLDLETDDGFARFQVILDRLGVSEALEEAGVAAGDSVRIADVEFEYRP